VTAAAFKTAIERVVDPRMKSPLAGQFSGIAGVVAKGRTLTIRLSHPDGGFIANLAGGAACAVPPDTPVVPGGLDVVPSAGPYYVSSYTPRQQIILKRNPNYHGDRPHRLDEIALAIGVDSSQALKEIEAGKADYALDGSPRAAGPALARRYGPGSKAAKEGHQQYFINPALGERWLHMNTSRPLFSDVRLRRAVSYAIDRAALVAQGRRFAEVNPFNAGEPTDDFMPSSIAGAPDFHVYANRPDLRRARRLAGHVHTTAVMYTPNLPPWQQEAQIVRRDLAPLGIDVQVKEFPIGDFFARIGRRGEPFDLAVSGWSFGTDPEQALGLFDGSAIRRTGNNNFSYFDDPAFDRQLHTAAKLSGPKRYRAYARLELELERDLVPAAAFATDASRDFFSARIGCQLYQPFWGIDLAALCLRH
jgi:ABC-type transport system substrate-binding protein